MQVYQLKGHGRHASENFLHWPEYDLRNLQFKFHSHAFSFYFLISAKKIMIPYGTPCDIDELCQIHVYRPYIDNQINRKVSGAFFFSFFKYGGGGAFGTQLFEVTA